jgi:galactokinase
MSANTVIAIAPGRVNLIGDHTDYTGGLVLPMAIHLATTITGVRGGSSVHLVSADEALPAVVSLDVSDPTACEPTWATYVAGVVKALGPSEGFTGTVSTTVPIGAGLSSSAAFEVALALALGADGTPLEIAQLCQRAENEATGVPTGIMDQLSSAAGQEGSALLIDCHELTVTPINLPADMDVVVIHSGEGRTLAGSGYTERAHQLAEAERVVGPLRLIRAVDDLNAITDDIVLRRARHVVTENERVRQFVSALSELSGDALFARLGSLMAEGQRSLRDDFENSTPIVDACIARLSAIPGVHGVRMTGGGFGGCVVALTSPGALSEGWLVRPAAGASLTVSQ